MNLDLVNNSSIGNVQCDFYRDGNDIFMTRKQIGEALEYRNPSAAIANIHNRYKDCLDRFSVTTKLVGTDGRMYNTYLYSARGIYEICRWSRQPKADEFIDWAYDLIDEYRKGKLRKVNDVNINLKRAEILYSIASSASDILSKESLALIESRAAELANDQTISS